MKRYKLIKEYPGSPKLGYIVNFKEEFPYVSPAEYEAGCKCNLSLYECQKYPEFWEEIKEPEFEILELQGSNGVYWYKTRDNKFSSFPHVISGRFEDWTERFKLVANFDKGYTAIENLVEKDFKITRVQRLSDKEIFTIGDKTNNGIIEKFELSGDMIRVHFKDKGNYHVNLNTIEHSKALFTTEDGVDKYKGDSYYYIVTGDISSILVNKWIVMCHTVDWDNPKKVPLGAIQFHNLTPAQEYIDLNKPKYSKKQVINVLGKKDFIGTEYLKEQLKI